MLRNIYTTVPLHLPDVLNEVLSLNAQELSIQSALHVNLTILNEVLSLNAQESVWQQSQALNSQAPQ